LAALAAHEWNFAIGVSLNLAAGIA